MNNKTEVLLEIGRRIESKRKELGLTQDKLAYSADIDRTTIGYVENGKQNITIGMLCKIANALNVDLSYFF